MVETLTELNLLMVSVDILTERFRSAEIERSAFHLQDFTSGNSCVVCRKIEVCVNLANLILNRWSRICCACQTKEGVMCQVDDSLLVSGSKIFDNQLVLVSKGKLYRYIQFTSKTFLTIGRYTMQCQ